MKSITLTNLRKEIFKTIDEIIKTGEPVAVKRNGHTILLSLVDEKPRKSKLDNIKPHNSIIGDPDDLVNIKIWEWNEPKNL